MTYGIEACALALLRADPEFAVPISRLHDALLEEAGTAAGPSVLLQERIRRRPDLFILLEPRPVPWEFEEWPERVRQEYHAALREAGLAPEPRVVPRSPLPIHEGGTELELLLSQINDTLVDLWDATEDDPDARSEVADALGAGAALHDALSAAKPATLPRAAAPRRDRPTTPPPGPPAGG